jgi:2-haloacid dehalogenase
LPRICMFDVNETLLDLKALDPRFERVFDDASVRGEWFSQLLQSAFVSTITGPYRDFGTIGGGALEMVAGRRGVQLSGEDKDLITGGMRELPPHPEVPESLARLRDGGLRLAALTNSTEEVAEAQLRNAGLREYFEQVLSADAAGHLKPAPEAYRTAAGSFGVGVAQVRLIAAHAWDIAGALSAGCAAAFVARPGMVLDPLVDRPDVVGTDLTEVAGRILEVERV